MAAETGVGCGISEWVGLRKAIYYHTLYILASAEQKEKHWQLSNQCRNTGNWKLQPWGALHSRLPPDMPLTSSMFRSPISPYNVVFTGPLKNTLVVQKLERKCQKETWAQIPKVTSVYFMVLGEEFWSSGLQLSCCPAPLYLGYCRFTPNRDLLLSVTRTQRRCG